MSLDAPTAVFRGVATRCWQVVRDAWLLLGATLLTFCLVWICYRAPDAVRHALRAAGGRGKDENDPLGAELAGELGPQYLQLRQETAAASRMDWKPYVYFRHAPFRGRYVNVDSLSHRVTPQPPARGPRTTRVFFFGGSTMWGLGQRDSLTIPAVVAQRLSSLAGGSGVQVTNLGEVGWVSTQEVLELMMQLRAGNVPTAAVFYDGINDPYSTLQGGPGDPGNEDKRVADFTLGRELAWSGHPDGLARDVHTALVLAGVELRDVARQLPRRFSPNAPGWKGPPMSPDSGARATARVYAENVRVIEALAHTYGFTPIYVWQPTFLGTDKPLTRFERGLSFGAQGAADESWLRTVYRAIPPMVGSSVAPMVGARFVDESTIFNGDSSLVFVDGVGHTSERAIQKIVDGFLPELRSAIVAAQGADQPRRGQSGIR